MGGCAEDHAPRVVRERKTAQAVVVYFNLGDTPLHELLDRAVHDRDAVMAAPFRDRSPILVRAVDDPDVAEFIVGAPLDRDTVAVDRVSVEIEGDVVGSESRCRCPDSRSDRWRASCRR
jgi:hypothetical protein